jgi:ABC-type transporter Mla MlaB component
MLRITKETSNGLMVLKLEGKLQGPWVATLREESRAARAGGPLKLDLSHIAFVDQAGLELLRELIGAGVKIGNCSNFVRELLNVERSKP